MVKKKVLLTVISVLTMAMLTACGDDNGETTSTEVSDTSVSISATTSTEEPELEPEPEIDPDLEVITLGTYEQDNNLDNGTEPIEWIVLESDDTKALVISKYILDCKPMVDGFGKATWETSDMRTWLNGDFYEQSFTDAEKARIIESFVPDFEVEVPEETEESATETDDVSSSDVSGDEAVTETESEPEETIEVTGTTDNIFLMSDFELEKYLYDDPEILGDEPYAKPTAYAIAQGVWVMTEDYFTTIGYDRQGLSTDTIGAGWWWLRTPGRDSAKTMDVSTFGEIRVNGHDNGESKDGVRPMMWITLE